MAVDKPEPRLIEEYEAIRRREYSLITDMLEVLPKINDLADEYAAQARDALFHADHPFLMVLVGPFSSGKSSLINALLGTNDLLRVGPVPTTDRISILRWGEEPQRMDSGGDVDAVFHPAALLRKVSLVDTPGLESVFQKHESITRKFLHRSDVVLLVMLATQAMTARNVEYIQQMRQYGKKVLILVNQADLLTDEERETVREYIQDQSRSKLGYEPPIFMVSAKKGLQARSDGDVDRALWRESGLQQIEDYIDGQLGDAERLRQKLQTPLQIVQNVNTVALRTLRSNQEVLDRYQRITDNVDQQLTAHKREQERIVREINDEIETVFGEVSMRGSEAIREVFQFSRGFGSIFSGLGELTGIARLFRRANRPGRVQTAFDKHNTLEPLDRLPGIVDRLGPRLEGRDLQDLDDLVKYSQREIKALPQTIREKVIGNVQAPVQYDRRPIQELRPALETIEQEARTIEIDKIGQAARSAMVYIALWEVLVVIMGIVVLASGVAASQPELLVVLLFLVIGMGMLGLVALPLVGRAIETNYSNRLLKTQARYIEVVSKAADKQIEYGMRLRRETVAPLTRLIEAQTEIQSNQLKRLQQADQEMARIEGELTKLGSRRPILGVRG